jgi:DNA-binding MarR family transcriptional regulator
MDITSENDKYLLFLKVMAELDRSFQFIETYNTIPQNYHDIFTYTKQKSHTIQMIGQHHGLTISELASLQNKTKSACSQMIKNLNEKNFVKITKKTTNKKERYLYLTEKGTEIYNSHEAFDHKCFMKAYERLIRLQQRICKLIYPSKKIKTIPFTRILQSMKKNYRNIYSKKREGLFRVLKARKEVPYLRAFFNLKGNGSILPLYCFIFMQIAIEFQTYISNSICFVL